MRVDISRCWLRHRVVHATAAGWLDVVAIGMAIGLAGAMPAVAVAATGAGDAAAAAAPIDACQERFLLDRRDDPRNALRNFHRCNAVRDVSMTMEKFTFWYITLPTHAREEGGWFAREWRNNLAVLQSPYVGLKQKDATDILDKSVVRGLQRGKRDTLADRWLHDHDPQILAETAPAADAHGATSGKPPTTAGPTATIEPAVSAGAAPNRRVMRTERRRYLPRRHYAAAISDGRPGFPDETSDEQLNRAELQADYGAPGPGYRRAPYYPADSGVARTPSAASLLPYYPLPAEPPAYAEPAPVYIRPAVRAPVYTQPAVAAPVPVSSSGLPQPFADINTVASTLAQNLRAAAEALLGPPARGY